MLPAFDIALAALASGLGPSLGCGVDSVSTVFGAGSAGLGSGSTGFGAGCTGFEPASADLGPGSGELPLSPTEAEMFRVLCVYPDWEEKEDCEKDGQCDQDADIERDQDADVDVEIVEEEPRSLKDGRSLRRSKRVADAVARTRGVRPRMRGPRHA